MILQPPVQTPGTLPPEMWLPIPEYCPFCRAAEYLLRLERGADGRLTASLTCLGCEAEWERTS